MTTDQLLTEFRRTHEDPACGACAETFFTGGTFHEHTCPNASQHEINLISVSPAVHSSSSQPKEP